MDTHCALHWSGNVCCQINTDQKIIYIYPLNYVKNTSTIYLVKDCGGKSPCHPSLKSQKSKLYIYTYVISFLYCRWVINRSFNRSVLKRLIVLSRYNKNWTRVELTMDLCGKLFFINANPKLIRLSRIIKGCLDILQIVEFATAA